MLDDGTSLLPKNLKTLQSVGRPLFPFLNNAPFFYLKKPTFLVFSDFLHQRFRSLIMERSVDNKNFIKRNFFLQRKGKKKSLKRLTSPGSVQNKLFFSHLMNKSFLHNANNLLDYI